MTESQLREYFAQRATTRPAGRVELDQVMARGRTVQRRRRRIAFGTAVAVVVAGGAVAVTVATNGTPADGRATVAPATSVPSSAPTLRPAPSPAPTFAPLSPTKWRPLAPGADEIIGLVGAGAEKVAVLDAKDGHVIGSPQSAGSQSLLFPFGDSLLRQANAGCRNDYTRIDPGTGATSPTPASLHGIGELASGSTNDRIAYGVNEVPHKQQERLPDGRIITVIPGCGATPVDLVVSNPGDGIERRWTGSGSNSLYPSLDAQALHVAFVLNGKARLLDLNGAQTRLDQAVVLPTQSDCVISNVRYQPGSDRILWVAQACFSGAVFVSSYDVNSLQLITRIQIADAGSSINFSSFDVDSSGDIVATIGSADWAAAGTDGRVLTIRAGRVQQLSAATGVYQVLW